MNTVADSAPGIQSSSWDPICALTGIEPPAFAVEVNQTSNLLMIRYLGRVTAAAVARCTEEVRRALGSVEPGFQLLVNLSELESMEADSVPHIEQIMELCDEKGVIAVVRVIPDPRRDIGLQIMSYFHYAAHVRIVTCATLDEAMTRLAD